MNARKFSPIVQSIHDGSVRVVHEFSFVVLGPEGVMNQACDWSPERPRLGSGSVHNLSN